MCNDPFNETDEIADRLRTRSDELTALAAEAAATARSFRVSADYFSYVSSEGRRAAREGVDFGPFEVDFASVKTSLDWDLPSPAQLTAAQLRISACTSGMTTTMTVAAEANPQLRLLGNPPASFVDLREGAEVTDALSRIDVSLAESWDHARDREFIGDPNAIRDAATHARTVVDGLRRLPDEEHLLTLPWCLTDNNGRPTRASVFAWIRHGDVLPAGLDDPNDDPTWAALNPAYQRLNKYVHIVDIQPADITDLRVQLSAVEKSLGVYLREGRGRLVEVEA